MPEKGNSIIESIRNYILTCPFLENWKVNVDYLGGVMEYSIDPLPADSWVRRYVDGGGVKQFQFSFTSKEEYDGDARTGIENSGFYQKFEEWIESSNKVRHLPDMKGMNQTAVRVETMTSGYLFDSEPDMARYQIQCRLIYEQEA